ncbi:alpha/beta fold hydrolase [Polaromonas sp.]|uniref:alpha/beta fold hydrolase n=1 Tax=Polaromonas sp. TaxID=1869339 RepID=UPI00286A2133|nr:alpha/beta fold hydrolase [Polaromonas sp.]
MPRGSGTGGPIMSAAPGKVWGPPRYVATARGARMAFRECGPPGATDCWLVLHGGPGGSSQPGMLQPMQLDRQRVVLPDQRGAGQSRPKARLAGNHTDQLVADLERLRQNLGIESWAVLAGSWGTVVALRYAQAHPSRVRRLVLRGAFALKRAEIFGLLRPHPQRDRAISQDRYWPRAPFAGGSRVLARLEQVLQSGTLPVAARHVGRCWNLLEQRSALRGLWRSLIHSALPLNQAPGLATGAHRQAWTQIRRQQRRALAGLKQARTRAADRRGWQKFRIQAHYLRHRGFVSAGGLAAAVHSLALNGIPVDWVHGRFDAVCLPANSRRWWAQQEALAPDLARSHWPQAGHLSGEPGMREALTRVVRVARRAPRSGS